MKTLWMSLLALAATCMTAAAPAAAAIKSETLTYPAGQVQAKSTLMYDDAATGKRPGVVVVPEWWGADDYAKHRAEMLAGLGYVAIVADMYGDGQTTSDPKQAGAWAGPLRSGDRKELRARVSAAVEQLKSNPRVDGSKIAAIGYCFGGSTVLELARSGAEVAGVVSFHGSLDTEAATVSPMKTKVLVCHGAEDTFVPPAHVQAFEDEMRKAKADWQLIVYSGAVHSFTNPAADSHKIPGIAYNKPADERSWQAMKDFLSELFR